MPEKPGDLVQGTLEMLVLKTLALEPMHGYGIALRLEQVSHGVFRINPGSLLPALSRLERAGRIKAEWRASENNRRARYYQLTHARPQSPRRRARPVGPPDRRHQPHPRSLTGHRNPEHAPMFDPLIAGLRALFRRDRRNAEIQRELDSFLEASIDDKIRSGMSRDQALRAARAEIGSTETVRQKVWSAGWESTAESLLAGPALRASASSARIPASPPPRSSSSPSASLPASPSSASSTPRSSSPLPYQDPSRLVVLYETNPLGPKFHLSYLDYLDWKRQNTVFSSLDIYTPYGFLLQTPTGTENADGARVSAGFFRTLGVTPILGRDFRPERRPGQRRLRPVLLSYAAWQRRFGGRSDVIGQTVILDGQPNTIIGVLPAASISRPLSPPTSGPPSAPTAAARRYRACHNLFGIARLKPGVTFASAFADIKTVADNLARQYP